tara:strand:+ start:1902 stop:2300 length:399 start_codon:yes stop_codon:yes gene_type:complete
MGSFFVDKKIYKERLDICRSCDKYIKTTGNCSVCLCFMRVKASIGLMSCPLEKWLATSKLKKVDEIPKHLIKEVQDLWERIKNGQAKNHDDKKKMIELYNTIYAGGYKVTTNCASCLNTCFKGIKRIIDENN